MDPDQKKQTKFLKSRLREGFDLTNEQVNALNTEMLLGKVAYVTSILNDSKAEGDTRKFVNAQNVVSERLYRERGGNSNGAAAATGATLGL